MQSLRDEQRQMAGHLGSLKALGPIGLISLVGQNDDRCRLSRQQQREQHGVPQGDAPVEAAIPRQPAAPCWLPLHRLSMAAAYDERPSAPARICTGLGTNFCVRPY